ncbi:MAG: hypothetical protein JXB48_02385 [Candidatus Latescibacteria bacterium]|nr:hypothetical protein [Candidatus Latescibacterota bacterium]
MNNKFLILPVFIMMCLNISSSAHSEMVSTHWGGVAEMAYDLGFMHRLMRHPDGGICLFNIDLIENDAPGAGFSEKGVYSDDIWGQNRVRKMFFLEDNRAEKAWVVICIKKQGKYPLTIDLNGSRSRMDTWDEREKSEWCRWVCFDGDELKNGKNTVELSCPEAGSKDDGWEIFIARADEFADGGGDPTDVGKTSFKSTDNGESWKESPFGPLGKTRAEYSVRLSLDRYVKTGWLATPVIDLWKGDSQDFIVPLRMIRKLRVQIQSEVPKDTQVEYYMRKGTAPGPFSDEWEPYELIGSDSSLETEYDGAAINRRYIQLRVELTTSNPLKTPVVKSVHVEADHEEYTPKPSNINVVSMENPPIKYSSINWEWESWDRPEFRELRERESLDDVIVGSTNEFNAQVRLMDHACKRWIDGGVLPDFPPWDALGILNHIDKNGAGGMCLQNNNFLAGLCMVYGWQARIVNISHEVCEVWNDEFGKWIYIDAHRVNQYMFDAVTAEPQSVLDLHRGYLDKYYPDSSIDWMNDFLYARSMDDTFPVKRGTLDHKTPYGFNSFNMAAQVRMVPRNNWYEKPTPRPLNHGLTQWQWNGYINWYDDRTPPNRKYSWFTDRPRDMWPDLNKVHIDATSGHGNDRLILRFETYTPNFCHFEVDVNDTGWKKAPERWAWILQSGRNTLRVCAVNKLGVKGKPSVIILNHGDSYLDSYRDE